jgi:hypothetical protein
VGIAEVDRDAGLDCEVDVASHLASLIPGERTAKMRGQQVHGVDQRGADLVGTVTVGQMQQHHEPGGPLDECSDGRAVLRPHDQVAFLTIPMQPDPHKVLTVLLEAAGMALGRPVVLTNVDDGSLGMATCCLAGGSTAH